MTAGGKGPGRAGGDPLLPAGALVDEHPVDRSTGDADADAALAERRALLHRLLLLRR